MTILFRLAVYAVSVAVSRQYAAGYWVVGPLFGLAVVFYDSSGVKGLKPLKHLAFVAASSVIYALVFWIANAKWSVSEGVTGDFVGPFPAGVVLGSVLLPAAHKVILGQRAFKAISVALSLVISFYALMLFDYFSRQSRQLLDYDFMTVAIMLWQGLYLYLFYRPERIK
jgi:hypothetical protein